MFDGYPLVFHPRQEGIGVRFFYKM